MTLSCCGYYYNHRKHCSLSHYFMSVGPCYLVIDIIHISCYVLFYVCYLDDIVTYSCQCIWKGVKCQTEVHCNKQGNRDYDLVC